MQIKHMIRKWLANTFNPPSWGNNILKSDDPIPTFRYSDLPVIGFVGAFATAAMLAVQYPEETRQLFENTRNFISEHIGSDAPMHNRMP